MEKVWVVEETVTGKNGVILDKTVLAVTKTREAATKELDERVTELKKAVKNVCEIDAGRATFMVSDDAVFKYSILIRYILD